MKRFLYMCAALPLLGCGQSFFVRVDLSLNGEGLDVIAIDPSQLREIQVQAIPDAGSGLEPVSFTISNDDGSAIALQQNNFLSYTLELPPELEGVPLTLVHHGFSVDSRIDTPVLFGDDVIVTEQGRLNGANLSVRDPKCNNVREADDFCPSRRTTGSVSVRHNGMLFTNTQFNNNPVVLLTDNDGNVFRQFAVQTDGSVNLVPGGNINFPIQNSDVLDTVLVSSLGNDFNIAILQNNEVALRNSVTGAGIFFAAPNVKAITAAELDLGPGGRDIAGITGSSLEIFTADAAGGFSGPISVGIGGAQGSPVLIETRRSQLGDQLGVVTGGASQLILFEFVANNPQQIGLLPLPGGSQPVALLFRDLDADGLDDALILDNGPNKRLLFFLLEGNGRLKPNGQSELALNGELLAVTAGKFDNNGSEDLAVSGLINGRDFVQFILSSASGLQVTTPRALDKDPRFLVSVPNNLNPQTDLLVVETTAVQTLNVIVPEQ